MDIWIDREAKICQHLKKVKWIILMKRKVIQERGRRRQLIEWFESMSKWNANLVWWNAIKRQTNQNKPRKEWLKFDEQAEEENESSMMNMAKWTGKAERTKKGQLEMKRDANKWMIDIFVYAFLRRRTSEPDIVQIDKSAVKSISWSTSQSKLSFSSSCFECVCIAQALAIQCPNNKTTDLTSEITVWQAHPAASVRCRSYAISVTKLFVYFYFYFFFLHHLPIAQSNRHLLPCFVDLAIPYEFIFGQRKRSPPTSPSAALSFFETLWPSWTCSRSCHSRVQHDICLSFFFFAITKKKWKSKKK